MGSRGPGIQLPFTLGTYARSRMFSHGAQRERDQSAAGRPVFVDSSGRRLRRSRIAGLLTVTGVIAYIGLVASAFFGAPDIAGPALPAGQSAQEVREVRAPVAPEEAAAYSPPARAPVPSVPETDQQTAPAPSPTAAPAPAPSPTTAPAPAPVPAEAPSPAPSKGNPAPDPGQSATAPGQANRPAPKQ